jgi:hypothetical protein
LEACRSKARDFSPTIEEFFIEAMKELDPEPTPPAVLADPSKREVKPKKYEIMNSIRVKTSNFYFYYTIVRNLVLQNTGELQFWMASFAIVSSKKPVFLSNGQWISDQPFAKLP